MNTQRRKLRKAFWIAAALSGFGAALAVVVYVALFNLERSVGGEASGLSSFAVDASRWLGGRLYPSQMLPGIFYPVVMALLFAVAAVCSAPRWRGVIGTTKSMEAPRV